MLKDFRKGEKKEGQKMLEGILHVEDLDPVLIKKKKKKDNMEKEKNYNTKPKCNC